MLGSIAVMSQAFPARVPAARSAGHCRVLMDGPPADRSTGRHTMPSTFQRIPAAAVSPQHAMIQLHAVPEGPASSGGPTFVDSAVPVPANKPDNDPTTYVDPAVLIPANKLDNKNTHVDPAVPVPATKSDNKNPFVMHSSSSSLGPFWALSHTAVGKQACTVGARWHFLVWCALPGDPRGPGGVWQGVVR